MSSTISIVTTCAVDPKGNEPDSRLCCPRITINHVQLKRGVYQASQTNGGWYSRMLARQVDCELTRLVITIQAGQPRSPDVN